MARSRVPACYGIFQFCCRTLCLVIEICAFATLATLSRSGENYPLGYGAIILGILFEMVEMVILASPVGHIRRLPSCGIVVGDFFLFCLGTAAFVTFFAVEWDRIIDDNPSQSIAAMWSPWYLWLQLAAAVAHFLCMLMHCVDSFRGMVARASQ